MNNKLSILNKQLFFLMFSFVFILSGCNHKGEQKSKDKSTKVQQEEVSIPTDTAAYNKKNIALAMVNEALVTPARVLVALNRHW